MTQIEKCFNPILTQIEKCFNDVLPQIEKCFPISAPLHCKSAREQGAAARAYFRKLL
ncbi:hypothetical protein [Arcanobacterium hippocoleae]|uniref:Transposase n=1 Tax=Arcanobacterium hippocoleae TaxID=149017 RepID=A0ABU1T2R4_9ACTO|nr:hypothetical protein [Arcanobacterium hippocoleae]MDR6939672.1 hypothetical protein [Arcanobacterium hippocoleae]